ncbi:MAG: signal peptidase I [Clostridia bacterium]|nr:signal peptidase I [Clostridia bacterium]
MKRLIRYIIIVLLIVLTAIVLKNNLIKTVRVVGTSMEDTLIGGDVVIVIASGKPDRGTIVNCRFDDRPDTYLKRIIGLPNDTIRCENNVLYINDTVADEPYTTSPTADFTVVVEPGHYFVMGDNRSNSYDSRDLGQISESNIFGTVRFRIWPLNRFGAVN